MRSVEGSNQRLGTARIEPVFAHWLDVFGAGRLVWGSDWPVVNLATGYDVWWDMARNLACDLGKTEREAIFGGNGCGFHGIDEEG